MSRDGLKIEDGGFPIYGENQERKVNAMRRAFSLPSQDGPIIPTKGQALFTTAEEMESEPSSCYNCQFFKGESCPVIGPRIKIKKFIYPKEATADSKPIEYWPCCSYHFHGKPGSASVTNSFSDPDYLDLVWINAARAGQEYGGANCGGCNGGDDCDHYLVEGKEAKWESPTGFCRALQVQVACGDVCSMWQDDDELKWREAQKIIEELDGK